MLDGLHVVAAVDRAAWESWMAEHHSAQPGAWLLIAKKGSGQPSVSLAEAADICLCYGWIDSIRRARDSTYYLQKYSPRRPTSSWSQVNVAKAEALLAAGRLQPAGLAEIAAAKADGRWEAAYESQASALTPPDLLTALAQNPLAQSFYESLSRTDRYAVILQLAKSRTAAVRARRVAAAVTRLADRSPTDDGPVTR